MDYRKMTEAELIGLHVTTTRKMEGDSCEVPAGTRCTIIRKSWGLGLVTDPCPTCGVRGYLRRVSPIDVELVKEEEKDESNK